MSSILGTMNRFRRASNTGRQGMALMVLTACQLMVVLDSTIVNVALPEIARSLEIKEQADLSWIVTGYTLAFGGFLLLGGKLADQLGRRRIFVIGVALFGVASLLGGFASNLGALVAIRLSQGIGAALMAPAALSLITVLFDEGPERNRALGIWSAITSGGAAVGLVLGGVLTEYASWHWVFLVNVPIAVIAIAGAFLFVPESRDQRTTSFDVAGAVLVTAGLIALVYALVEGNNYGWTSIRILTSFGGAVLTLAAFVVVQRRKREPLIDFTLFKNRTLLGADLCALFLVAGIFAIFFFLVLWMQQVKDYSPIEAGVAFLPMTLAIGLTATGGARLLGLTGPRWLLVGGCVLAGGGLLVLGVALRAGSSYGTVVLPPLVMVGLGMGLTFVALTSAAVAGVPPQDAGIASALLSAGQQVGGALGLSLLTAIATARTGAIRVANSSGQPGYVDALVDGWRSGFFVGAGLLVVAALIAATLVRGERQVAAAAHSPVSVVT